MRGTTAKRIRALAAEVVEAGTPEGTPRVARAYMLDKRTREIRLHPHCARAVYQTIKRHYRAAVKRGG
jgi:hypothetical protein